MADLQSRTAQTVEVTGFTFDFKGMIYKIPDVSVGDLIIHQKKPMYVTEITDSTFGNMDMSKLMMISMLSGNSNPFGNMFNFNLNTQNK